LAPTGGSCWPWRAGPPWPAGRGATRPSAGGSTATPAGGPGGPPAPPRRGPPPPPPDAAGGGGGGAPRPPALALPRHPPRGAGGFSPDGSVLATGDLAGAIRVWGAGSGGLLAQIGSGDPLDQVWRLQFGPGGEYLAAAGGHLVAWTVRAASGRVTLERLCTL